MPLPYFSRAGHQSIAQDQRKAAGPPVPINFHETVGLLDQNFFGQIGMTKELERFGAEPKAQCIAVLAPPCRHHLQRVSLELTQVTQQGRASRNIDKRKGHS
jgi:hypothetical protein